MQFKIALEACGGHNVIPINYQYPLSSAFYRVLQKGDAGYADFLHEKGYGKGYKFFTFSDLKMRYKREGDRMKLLDDRVEVSVHFHLPEASRTFVEGLFRSEEMVIADKKSKALFKVASIVAKENPLKDFEEKEIVQITVRPTSAIVAGIKNKDGNYDFLNPDDPRFTESIIYNWRQKIAAAWDENTSLEAILSVVVQKYDHPFRSRLITIKAGTDAETKIRGYLNFKLVLTAERRFLELAVNAGVGLYPAQGMGCLEVVESEKRID